MPDTLTAALIPAPDMPAYDELPDGLEARAALPARFHIPVWDSLGKPNGWQCAVCWDEFTVSQWPCAPAMANGGDVFEPVRRAGRGGAR